MKQHPANQRKTTPPARLAISQLIHAAKLASEAMCESVNLDLAAGNGDFEDVRRLNDAIDALHEAINRVEQPE